MSLTAILVGVGIVVVIAFFVIAIAGYPRDGSF